MSNKPKDSARPDEPGQPRVDPSPTAAGVSRRHFLHGGAMMTGVALVSAAGGSVARAATPTNNNLPPNVPEWMKAQGHPVATPAYGVPSHYESHVVREAVQGTPTGTAAWSFTPLQDLTGIITPNGLVYERHHAGVPDIDPDQHRLMVHGLVQHPTIYTMDDLVRFPSVSRIHFLECSGNSYSEWTQPLAQSVQKSHGLLSCCEWTGVPLSIILEEVGVEPDAQWMLAEGADAAAMDRSIPIGKAWNDAILVYAQNGERLRPEQGYPLRLLVPGYEGNTNIKWLRRLKFGAKPFETREETSKYTDLMPDGKARQFTLIMETKSVITFPAPGHQLKQQGFYEITGLAWSGHGRIRRVDVSTDGGKNWHPAALQEPILDRALVRFRFPWHWNGAPAVLQSRAIDESGYAQPTRQQLVAVRGTHSTYHYNGIESWQVNASGKVENVLG